MERFKQDLEELYASSTVISPPTISTPTTLPDIIGQQEEFPSTSLPLAVEQLELEVRQEILQHTLDPPASSLLLPDLTAVSNANHEDNRESSTTSQEDHEVEEEEEEKLSFIPVIGNTQITNNSIFQNEPDLIQHETQTPVILHSVDSIVNAPTGTDFEVEDQSFLLRH